MESTEITSIDLLISSPWIVPVVPRGTLLENHSLAIKDKRIVAIGPTGELQQHYQTSQRIELDNHVLIPGLVNAHGHASMALFRGVADDIPLKQWLEDRIWPLESSYVSREFVYEGVLLAMAEMISGGTTCFADNYFFAEEVARAVADTQMRAQLACPILDFPTAWGRDADDYIGKATQLHDNYRSSEFVYSAFGPHAPYTISDEPLKKIAVLADELDVPVHIHMHETAQEVTDAMATDGRRPLQRMADLGLVSPRLVCAHMTQATTEEIDMLAAAGSSVVHCPSSNLKLASGLCEVHKMMEHGVNVALGTDGAASNNDLDMFGEMQLAAMLAKVVAEDATAIPAETALEMATINSARAMGLDRQIGSLEVGKFADIAAVSMNPLNTIPVNNPQSHLVYATGAHQVSHVWCSGKALLVDGELHTMDEAFIRERAVSWQNKFKAENIS